MKPTLYVKGSIQPPKNATTRDKEMLKNTVPVDYIMDKIGDRLPRGKTPASPGDRVIYLQSGTGSGKSTIIAPEIYTRFSGARGGRFSNNIAITQPRVLTAIDITKDIPKYYKNISLGENIGYQTGPIQKRPTRGIIFMTVGVLLQQLIVMEPEAFMNKYRVIIIDEVHERDINVDTLLLLLNKLIKCHWKDPRCPLLILMSATFNPKIFMDYFSSPKENLITICGQVHPIEKNFAQVDVSDLRNYVLDKIEHIHIDNLEADNILDSPNNTSDIIIFVHKYAEIKFYVEQVHRMNSYLFSKPLEQIREYNNLSWEKKIEVRAKWGAGEKHYYLLPVGLNSESFKKGGIDYQNLFTDLNKITVPVVKKGKTEYVKPSRRVIIATNVAETGITINSLKYCIDTGKLFFVHFNPEFNCTVLTEKHATRDMVIQRMGRVGRLQPGTWYGCFTKETYEALPPEQFSNIITQDLTLAVLSLVISETNTTLPNMTISELSRNKDITEKIDKGFLFRMFSDQPTIWYHLVSEKPLNMSSINFFESPSIQAMNTAVAKLHGLGFIYDDYTPSPMGFFANQFRELEAEQIRVLLAGYQHEANILDLVTIIAGIRVGWTSFAPMKSKYKPREPFKNAHNIVTDECVELLFIWDDLMKEVKSVQSIRKWCKDNDFRYDGIIKLIEIRDQILENMISVNLNPYYNGLDIEKGKYNLVKILKDNLGEGLQEITKIKKCLLEGYRFNLAKWVPNISSYVSMQTHVPVQVSSFIKERPNYIISSQIVVRKSYFNPGIFEYYADGFLSAMDNFVDVDLNLL